MVQILATLGASAGSAIQCEFSLDLVSPSEKIKPKNKCHEVHLNKR